MVEKITHQSIELKLILLSAVFCIGLSSFRVLYTQSSMFLFLVWNLFLALIPFLITNYLKKNKRSLLFLIANSLLWLLFLPNAPYILTDIIHLKRNLSMPFWFDLILVISYAWTGLISFYFSVFQMEKIAQSYLGKWTKCFIIFIFFLTGFGIYLGRYLRFNSWDIIQDPYHLFYDIFSRFMNPFTHPKTWGVTLTLGSFLTLIYLTLNTLNNKNIQYENNRN